MIQTLRAAPMRGIVDVQHALVIDEQIVVERMVIRACARGDLVDIGPLAKTARCGAVGHEVVHDRGTGCIMHVELNELIAHQDVVVYQGRVKVVITHLEEHALFAVVHDHITRDTRARKTVVQPHAVVQGIVCNVVVFDQAILDVVTLDTGVLIAFVADEPQGVVAQDHIVPDLHARAVRADDSG